MRCKTDHLPIWINTKKYTTLNLLNTEKSFNAAQFGSKETKIAILDKLNLQLETSTVCKLRQIHLAI